MKRIVMMAAVTGVAAISLSVAAYSTPIIERDAGPVRHCKVREVSVYQRSPCPTGTQVKGWNLRTAVQPGTPEGQKLSGNTPREEAALQRIAERNRAARVRSQQQSSMPRLDVRTRCQRVASVGGGYSASTFNACMRREQGAYDSMSSLFSSMPAPIRERCLRVATVGGGGSYSTLKACLEREQGAASTPPSFTY